MRDRVPVQAAPDLAGPGLLSEVSLRAASAERGVGQRRRAPPEGRSKRAAPPEARRTAGGAVPDERAAVLRR